MKLASIRDLKGIVPVLYDPYSSGVDPVYWVFSNISKDKWENITIIVPGLIGNEYPKTFGHYHGSLVTETYKLVSGEGTLMLQKKHYDKASGVWSPELVDEVILIEAKEEDEIIIPSDYGHSWSNTGQCPLISVDDWRSGHLSSDYEEIQRLKGMAYYLTFQDNEKKLIENPNYVSIPKPVYMTAKEFNSKTQP